MNYQDQAVGSVQLPHNSPAWLIQLAASVETVNRSEFLNYIEAFKESVQKRWREAAISEVRERMSEFGLTSADVFGRTNRSGVARAAVAPKYRDPATGKTWSGRGKAPKWLEGKNKGDFVI